MGFGANTAALGVLFRSAAWVITPKSGVMFRKLPLCPFCAVFRLILCTDTTEDALRLAARLYFRKYDVLLPERPKCQSVQRLYGLHPAHIGVDLRPGEERWRTRSILHIFS